jgi:F-type H+-transporting ATPase subunit a
MIAVQPAAAFLNGLGTLVLGAGSDPLSHVRQETIVHAITNHMVMLALAALLLLIVVPVVARKKELVPRGFRNFLEAILQFIREEVARPALGHHTDRFIPFLWTMFLLILTANLLGMVPIGAGLAAAGRDDHLMHWAGTATGNVGITAGLALCSFFLFHASGIRAQGLGHYLKNTFVGHGPVWLAPLFIPIEIIGALVKPFALAIRLFANMTGGHVVMAVLLGFAVTGLEMGTAGQPGMLGVTLVSVLGAVAISLLELFVAFLQAYIFTFLTALFLGAALHPEH